MDQVDYWKTDFEAEHREILYRMQVQTSLGLGALKSMMLVNGGSIIALLTFIGNKGAIADRHSMKVALALFGAGLFVALLSYFAAYFSQNDFMLVAAYRARHAQARMIEQEAIEVPPIHDCRGGYLLYAAIVLLLASLVAFGLGAFSALDGLLN